MITATTLEPLVSGRKLCARVYNVQDALKWSGWPNNGKEWWRRKMYPKCVRIREYLKLPTDMVRYQFKRQGCDILFMWTCQLQMITARFRVARRVVRRFASVLDALGNGISMGSAALWHVMLRVSTQFTYTG